MWNPIILDVFVECIVCKKTLQKLKHDPREVSRNMGKIANNANRRSRTPNWSVEEKQYLLELIRDRKEVVIPKTNSGPLYSEEKDTAWNEILLLLAVKYGNKFVSITTKKVKTQWQNMKRIARDEITIHGTLVNKYSPQSLEVCTILDLVKDGVLKPENEILNTNNTTITPDIEVKAEPVDEDTHQPSGSGLEEPMETNVSQQHESCSQAHVITETIQQESSIMSSNSEQEDLRIYEHEEETSSPLQCRNDLTNAPNMMQSSLVDDDNNLKHFQGDVQDFMKYTSIEKRLRMDTLKEERQTARAMRETAELNKIIAEQKLKHVLWMKKHEMA